MLSQTARYSEATTRRPSASLVLLLEGEISRPALRQAVDHAAMMSLGADGDGSAPQCEWLFVPGLPDSSEASCAAALNRIGAVCYRKSLSSENTGQSAIRAILHEYSQNLSVLVLVANLARPEHAFCTILTHVVREYSRMVHQEVIETIATPLAAENARVALAVGALPTEPLGDREVVTAIATAYGVDGGFIRHLIGFTDEQRLLYLRAAAREALEAGWELTHSGANSPSWSTISS